MIFYRFVLASLLTAAIVKFRGRKSFADFRPGLVLGTACGSCFSRNVRPGDHIRFQLRFIRGSTSRWSRSAVFFCSAAAGWSNGGRRFLGFRLWVLTGRIKSVNRRSPDGRGRDGAAFHILFSGMTSAKPRSVGPVFSTVLRRGRSGRVADRFDGPSSRDRGSRTASNVLYLRILATVSTIAIQTLAQRHLDAVVIALIFTLEPVFAAFFAWTAEGEPFLVRQALGGLDDRGRDAFVRAADRGSREHVRR